ncbi:hypothetical protein BREVUG8_100400 [Brevundimonas sp. G8]|nr:hypothetical protein BREVUG8_100400 [Brevundimonas sp. G8]
MAGSTWDRRVGRSAMTAARSASLSARQPAISFRVRKQPRHRPLSPSTAQTMTQGVAMALGGPGLLGLGTLIVTQTRKTLRLLTNKFANSRNRLILPNDAKRLTVESHWYDASLFIVLRKETPR